MKKAFVILFSFSLFLIGCGGEESASEDSKSSELDDTTNVEKENGTEVANLNATFTPIRTVLPTGFQNVSELKDHIGDPFRAFITPPDKAISSDSENCKIAVNLPMDTDIEKINLVHVTKGNIKALCFDVIVNTNINNPSSAKLKFFEIPISGPDFNSCLISAVVVKDINGNILEKNKVVPDYNYKPLPPTTNTPATLITAINYSFHQSISLIHSNYQVFADLPDSNSFQQFQTGQTSVGNILVDLPIGKKIGYVYKEFVSAGNELVFDVILVDDPTNNTKRLQQASFNITWTDFQQADLYIVTVNDNGGKKRKVIQVKTRPYPLTKKVIDLLNK